MTTSRRILSVAAALALVAAACGGGAPAAQDEASGDVYQPVANASQIMSAITIPASDRIFESVVYENGELTTQPETLDEWAQIEFAALAVAESGNLLLIPPRRRDEGDWVARSHEMTDAAMAVLQAARAQDPDGVLEAGSTLYDACLNCHNAYIPPDVP